jgi:hypothetical protein
LRRFLIVLVYRLEKAVPIRLGAEYCVEILSAVAARKIAGKMPFGNSGQAGARMHDYLDRAL